MLKLLKSVWHGPTKVEMYRKQLVEAERDLADYEHNLEFYQANVPMLRARVARLRMEVAGATTPVQPRHVDGNLTFTPVRSAA